MARGTISMMFAVVAMISLSACSGGFEAGTLKPASALSGAAADDALVAKGKTLYINNCAGCHGALTSSQVKNKTLTQIRGALDGVLAMEPLQLKFSTDDLKALAAALGNTSGPDLVCEANDFPKNTIRRMNSREFLNSTRDLLGAHSVSAESYPQNLHGALGFDTDADAIRTLGADAEKIVVTSEKIVDQIMSNASSKFNSCNGAANRQACVTTLLSQTAYLAFRRPVQNVEVQGLVAIAMTPSSTAEGVRNALVAMISSPAFLFHVVDYTVNVTAGVHTLSPFELASKLSFFIWSSIPDDQLLNLAANNRLDDPTVLREQVRRMLADRRAGEFSANFPKQWLGYWPVETTVRDQQMYPDFNATLKSAIMTEPVLLFNDVLKRDLAVETLVTADYTFVDPSLAAVYEIPYPSGAQGFARVALDGVHRRGILTQPALMTVTANGDYPNPIKRGVAVLNHLLCEPMGAPAAGVPTFGELPTELTIRARLAAHRTNATCASCHTRIDPIGLGLENFDGIGRWRSKYEDGLAIDSSGTTAEGEAFRSPGELARVIGDSGRFSTCFTKYLSAYAMNRAPAPSEKCQTDEITKKAALSGGKSIKGITESLVTSEYFKKSRIQ